MEKNESKRRRKLSAKLAAMLGLPIAVTSCGPVENLSNVGTNYEEPKKPVIEQETTAKTTADMTIEEILTTRKSNTINNTVTTANNSYNDNGYTNNDYYYDDTVYLDPEDVPTYQEPGIPQYQPQTQGNTQGNAQKPTQGSTQGNTQQSTQGSTQKPTKPETKPTSKPTTNESKTTTKTETPTSKKTTTKTTTKTTKKTTITTTTKPTTTTTTTTKKPETTTTQAPVIEEPVVDEFILENIGKNAGVFDWYANELKLDIMNGNALSMSYTDYTPGGREAKVLLAMLNEGYISDDVLGDAFADFSKEELKNYTEFIYSIADIQEKFGTDVDFSKYTLNPEIGTYINDIDNAYRNGEIDNFLYDVHMNGNIPSEYIYNSAIMSMLSSYDKNDTYMYNQDADVFCVDNFINILNDTVEQAKGISYTR